MTERTETAADIMKLPVRNPETGERQTINVILETPDGPVVIGTGFKTLQEAWDAAVQWRPLS
jgi:hypothetical protein